MSVQSDFQFLSDNFAGRLVSDLGVPQELADKVAEVPMLVDEDPEVNRMRAEWITHCAMVAREEAERRQR